MNLYLHQNGEQVGPYTEEDIAERVAYGELSRDDIVWHEGLTEWQPIYTVLSLPGPIAPPPNVAVLESSPAPLPTQTRSRRKYQIMAAVALIVFGIFYFGSPYLSLLRMKNAVERNDAICVSDQVDFPQLRESLKASIHAQMAKEATQEDTDGFGALGTAFAAMMVGPLVDAMLTPEGLIAMMQGRDVDDTDPSPSGYSESTDEDVSASSSSSNQSMDVSRMGYENLNRFSVTVSEDSTEAPDSESVVLLFQRHGLFFWKLTGIRM